MSKELKLRSALEGHGNDVKCLVVVQSGLLISGSRDKTCRFWTESSDVYDSGCDNDLLRFDQYVNSLAVFPPKRGDGPSLIFIGTTDGKIHVFSSQTRQSLRTLEGHKANVCSLCVDNKQSLLMSGSWDCTARIWPIANISDNVSHLLSGHESSVWSVCSVPDTMETFITASADKTIKLWIGTESKRSFTGHTDVVRDIACINSKLFLSCGNDACVMLWNLDNGECMKSFMSTAGNFIYSLIILNDGCIATASEGGQVEIISLDDSINEEENAIVSSQLIQVPADSVWCLAELGNGDITCGASDGKIWIFTRDASRIANESVISSYDAALAAKIEADIAHKPKDDGTITIKVDLEEGKEQLDLKYRLGEDPMSSAERFIMENHLPIGYTQQIVEFIKANVPQAAQVTQKQKPQAPAQKATHNGKQWDYVFDLTVDDGRNLKLPFNIDEDPWFAAQRFLQENGLPVQFLNQVAQFIKTQVPKTNDSQTEPYADPFTGGNRYVPGSGAAGSEPSSDPFTGSGRYIPGSGTSTFENGSAGGGDPFTGSGRYVPNQSVSAGVVAIANLPADKRRPRGENTPIKDFFRFGLEGASAKSIEKLKQNNCGQTIANQLSEEQLSALEQLMTSETADLSNTHLVALSIALKWPIESLVPVLDVFRVAVLHQFANDYFFGLYSSQVILTRLQDLLISDPPVPIRVLICRSLANACVHQIGRKSLIEKMAQTIALITPGLKIEKPIVQIAAAYALANFSLTLLYQAEVEKVNELGPREDCVKSLLSGLLEIDSFGMFECKALMALLQSVVTILWGDTTSINQAKSLGLQTVVTRLKDATQGDAQKAVARDIECMIYDG